MAVPYRNDKMLVKRPSYTPAHIQCGLACAIRCRREGLKVTILEKTAQLSEVGAGIQLPPNATRVMRHFGLLDELYAAGMVVEEERHILRWRDGSEIGRRPGSAWMESSFGERWHAMHRADYQSVLVREAHRLGVDLRLGSDVVSVDCTAGRAAALLANGESIDGDVIVGADGLNSCVRASVLGRVQVPRETGDLAYRLTIPTHLFENEKDPWMQDLIHGRIGATWWGPEKHVVCYAIRDSSILNLVLCCPDDLPVEVRQQPGNLAEMRKLFEDWDSRLNVLLCKVDKALKWKVLALDPVQTWVKGSVALLGDACHASAPYAASGAAMAVEDGATLGRMLGLFCKAGHPKSRISELLELFEYVRKTRSSQAGDLAANNRPLFNMADGQQQQHRDSMFKSHDWRDERRAFPWAFADFRFQSELYGFDALDSAARAFEHSCFAASLH